MQESFLEQRFKFPIRLMIVGGSKASFRVQQKNGNFGFINEGNKFPHDNKWKINRFSRKQRKSICGKERNNVCLLTTRLSNQFTFTSMVEH